MIFRVKKTLDFDTPQAQEEHLRIGELIKPDYLVTNSLAGRFWKEKKICGDKYGARLLSLKTRSSPSTRIIKFFAGEL